MRLGGEEYPAGIKQSNGGGGEGKISRRSLARLEGVEGGRRQVNVWIFTLV